MNISEVAERAGLPPKTIRCCEDVGLIRPMRTGNGYRQFRESDLHKLAFLGRSRSLGLMLEECRKLLELYEDRDRASADVKELAERHLREIDRKIRDLTEMCRTLAILSIAAQAMPAPIARSSTVSLLARTERRARAGTKSRRLRNRPSAARRKAAGIRSSGSGSAPPGVLPPRPAPPLRGG